MINIQKDIVDRCRVIINLIDVIYESSDDITVFVDRSEKIKDLSTYIHEYRIQVPSGKLKWVRSTSIPETPGKDKSIIWHVYCMKSHLPMLMDLASIAIGQ